MSPTKSYCQWTAVKSRVETIAARISPQRARNPQNKKPLKTISSNNGAAIMVFITHERRSKLSGYIVLKKSFGSTPVNLCK